MTPSKRIKKIRKGCFSIFQKLCLLYASHVCSSNYLFDCDPANFYLPAWWGRLQLRPLNDGGTYLCAVPVGLLIFWLYRRSNFSTDLRHKKDPMTYQKVFLFWPSLTLAGIFNLFSQVLKIFWTFWSLIIFSWVAAAGFDNTDDVFIQDAYCRSISRVDLPGAGLDIGKYGCHQFLFLLFGIFHGVPQIISLPFVELFSLVTPRIFCILGYKTSHFSTILIRLEMA